MKKKPNIIEAIRHPKIFRPLLGDLSTWHSWIVWLKSVFGLLMDPAELELYRKCTGRTDQPKGFRGELCDRWPSRWQEPDCFLRRRLYRLLMVSALAMGCARETSD